MKDLAKQYKASAALLRKRIAEIEQDPEIYDEDRVKPLINMLNDLLEVTREVEHYFDRWWWRSGKYTFNQNKPKPAVYSEPVYDTTGYERKTKRRNESLFGNGYSIVTYGKAKKSNKNVLRRRKNNVRNSRSSSYIQNGSMQNT